MAGTRGSRRLRDTAPHRRGASVPWQEFRPDGDHVDEFKQGGDAESSSERPRVRSVRLPDPCRIPIRCTRGCASTRPCTATRNATSGRCPATRTCVGAEDPACSPAATDLAGDRAVGPAGRQDEPVPRHGPARPRVCAARSERLQAAPGRRGWSRGSGSWPGSGWSRLRARPSTSPPTTPPRCPTTSCASGRRAGGRPGPVRADTDLLNQREDGTEERRTATRRRALRLADYYVGLIGNCAAIPATT